MQGSPAPEGYSYIAYVISVISMLLLVVRSRCGVKSWRLPLAIVAGVTVCLGVGLDVMKGEAGCGIVAALSFGWVVWLPVVGQRVLQMRDYSVVWASVSLGVAICAAQISAAFGVACLLWCLGMCAWMARRAIGNRRKLSQLPVYR